MSIIITCGHQYSEYLAVRRMLAEAGVADALPSPQRGYSPADLSQMMCVACQIEAADPNSIAQIQPGKAWLTLASDLIVANLGLTHWGWTDPNCIYFLEFWRDFDPRVKFVLVYSSPTCSVARLIATQRPSPNAADLAITHWQAFNETLLRFYYKNEDRCILVNSAGLANPAITLVDVCKHRLDLDLNENAAGGPLERQDLAIETMAASVLTKDATDARALYQEMETAADVPYAATHEPIELAYRAWQQHHELQDRLERALEFSAPLTAEKEAQVAATAPPQLDQRDEGPQRLSADEGSLLEPVSDTECAQDNEPRRSREEDAALQDLKKENDLLLRQLHSAQEELEHCVLMYQELVQSSQKNSPGGNTQNDKEVILAPGSSVTIDMRKSTDGDNWEPLDGEGRWARAGNVSTIRLPTLPNGRYKVQLDVLDAISPSIIRSLELCINGIPIHLKYGPRGMNGPFARLRRAYMILIGQIVFPLRLTGQMEVRRRNAGSGLTLEFHFSEVLPPDLKRQTGRSGRTLKLKKIQITRHRRD